MNVSKIHKGNVAPLWTTRGHGAKQFATTTKKQRLWLPPIAVTWVFPCDVVPGSVVRHVQTHESATTTATTQTDMKQYTRLLLYKSIARARLLMPLEVKLLQHPLTLCVRHPVHSVRWISRRLLLLLLLLLMHRELLLMLQ